jgi:IclR family acetate operon transcriptional repressor
LALQVRFPGLTVHFGAFSGADLVYVDKLEARRAYRMASTIGMRLPFHCTAIGKAVLAELSPDVRSNLLSDVGLPRRTSRTITETGLLDAELARIKHKGFALDNEENEDGVRCVAAPVFGALAGVIGGISVSAPAFELPEVQLEWVASFVIEAAAEVSLSLGALDAVVAAQRQRASALRGVPPQ